jgi:cytochrome c peroxidase
MKFSYYPLIFALAFFVSCGNDESGKKKEAKDPVSTNKEWAELKSQASNYFAVLPQQANNPENSVTPEKVELGQVLYFDKRLSKDQNQSCNTCHDLNNYGADGKVVSDGDDGVSKGTRNSPTVFNAALHFAQFWDGRAKDVEEQAGMPITNPVEMNIPSEEFLVERLKKVPFYKEMFAKAYPNDKDPITYKNISKAIAAFERKLITPSRFDKYLAGDESALTNAEKEGLNTFITSGCITCHTGPLVGGQMMQKFPIMGKYEDYLSGKVDMGKYEETKNDMDKFMWKVPSLRNVTKTAPYLHDGSKSDLKEVIQIMGKAELAREISDADAQKIITFLGSLEGDIAEEYKIEPIVLLD